MTGRRLRGLGVGGRPDVEGEAVFAGAGVVEDHVGIAAGLDAVGAEVFGGADALPLCGGLRRLPAEIADGRRGEGNAFEGADLMVVGECAFDYCPCRFLPGAGRRGGRPGRRL